MKKYINNNASKNSKTEKSKFRKFLESIIAILIIILIALIVKSCFDVSNDKTSKINTDNALKEKHLSSNTENNKSELWKSKIEEGSSISDFTKTQNLALKELYNAGLCDSEMRPLEDFDEGSYKAYGCYKKIGAWGTFDVRYHMYDSNVKKDKMPMMPKFISLLDAMGICQKAIKLSANHPDTVDLDWNYDKLEYNSENQVLIMIYGFSAENSYGVKDTFKAHCYFQDKLTNIKIFKQ